MTGRWPANVIVSPGMAEVLDAQSGLTKATGRVRESGTREVRADRADRGGWGATMTRHSPDDYGDGGGASRFFLSAGYEPWEYEWIITNGLTPCGQ